MRNPDPRVAKAPRKIEALDKTKANQRAWRLISQPIQIRECIRCSAFWSLYQYPIRELAALGGLFKTAKTKQMGTFKRCNATRNYLLPPLKPITPFPSLLRISRRKPTPRVHPPPWDQEGGSTKQRRGEEGTNPAGDSSIEAGLFFKVFCGSLGSLRGESRAPPPWGRRKLKTKTRGLLQPRLWRQRCPQRGRAWGAGAAPQLEGGRTASGMKLGLWGRGGRRWQGGEGSDAGPGAPLRRRVPDLWRQVRRPPPRPVLTGPWRRGLVEAHLRHGEWACRGSRGFFVRGWDLAGGVGVPTPQPRERLRSCPQPGDGHWRRKNVGERSRESGRLKTILWLHTPPPILSRGLAGVVLPGLTAPGLSTVEEAGHQWMEGCCPGTGWAGTLSPDWRATPRYCSLGSRSCHSGGSGVGSVVADGEGLGAGLQRKGFLELGSPGEAGLRNLLPPLLCSVARLSLPSPLLCKAPTPRPTAVAALGALCGEKPLPHGFRWGGCPDTAARGQFPVCETARRPGPAGLTQRWPADQTAAPPPATPPWRWERIALGFWRTWLIPSPAARRRVLGRLSLEVLALALFCPLPPFPLPPGYPLIAWCLCCRWRIWGQSIWRVVKGSSSSDCWTSI